MHPSSSGQGFSADSVAVSPDGSVYAAGGGGSGEVNLYDVDSGERLGGVTAGESVDALAFSPNAAQLAVATYEGLYVLTSSGLAQVEHIGKDIVYDVAFDPLGRFLLVSRGRGVELLEADGAHRSLQRLVTGNAYRYDDSQIAINSTGTRLAVARGGGLWVWTVNPDGTLGAMHQHRLKLDTGVSEAGALAFVRQTKVVVVGGDKVAVVGADSGYRSAVWRAPDDTFYRGVTTGAGGRVFVYGDSGDVTILDDDLVTIGSFTVDADEVLDAALTPDGTRLIVGGGTGSVTSWDVSSARRLGPPPFAGDGDNASAAILDATHVAATGRASGLTTWEAGGSATSPFTASDDLAQGRDMVLDVTANDDGSVVTATTNTEIFVVRDGESGKVPLPSRQMTSTPVRLSDDGSLAVTGLYDGPLVVIDTATRAITRSWDASSSIMDVDVSPDGSLAAAGLISGHVLVASPDDGTEHILDPGLGTIQALAFSPDGGLVLAGSTGRLTLVHPADGTVIRTFDSGVAGRVEVARFTPDGALLLTGGSDNALRIWRVASGEQLASMPTVRPYASEVGSIDLSADGRTVIWSEGERVVLFPGLLSMAADDCEVVQPYLTVAMVQRYLPEGRTPGCDYP